MKVFAHKESLFDLAANRKRGKEEPVDFKQFELAVTFPDTLMTQQHNPVGTSRPHALAMPISRRWSVVFLIACIQSGSNGYFRFGKMDSNRRQQDADTCRCVVWRSHGSKILI